MTGLGLYYDASGPSRLETLIRQPLSAEESARGQALVSAWRDARASKYNHAREHPDVRVAVLVADGACPPRGTHGRRRGSGGLAPACHRCSKEGDGEGISGSDCERDGSTNGSGWMS